MLKTLTFSEFSSVLGSPFQLVEDDPARQLQLELLEAKTIGDRPAESESRSQAFSLLFKGPGDVMLTQQTCHLKHSKLGELSIFLVPVGYQEDGVRYEAIFN